MSKWYIDSGSEPEVAVSTRVRLARNLKDYPFPARLDGEGKQKVIELVKSAVLGENSPLANEFEYIDMSKIDGVKAGELMEKHLISPEFARSGSGEGLLLKKDESVSIMLCEEDHIRLQVMSSGLAPEETYDMADKIDSFLDSQLQFAYDDTLGYLTQCPTNLGTGMRASVMLHLPALEELGQIQSLANTVSRLGLALRGTYGEGSEAKGSFYQLSNQVTLGISEDAALKNLRSITEQVIAKEKAARKTILEKTDLEDRIWRSLGVLLYARKLSSSEFMGLISMVRLGVAMNMINIGYDTINRLTLESQPSSLMLSEGKMMTDSQRDTARAALVRTHLAKALG